MHPMTRVWRKNGRVTAQRHSEHSLPNPVKMTSREIIKEAEAIILDDIAAACKEAREWIEDVWEDMPEDMTNQEVRTFIRRYYYGGWDGFQHDRVAFNER